MSKIGAILIYIIFIIESIVIIPLIWTIPGFKLYGKINRSEANEN